ncbi:MAG: hypothetical protein HY402_06430 [Elusimicrobia bacterium]|nr:hypothetical protein [Elusimicrobiota bacterium]
MPPSHFCGSKSALNSRLGILLLFGSTPALALQTELQLGYAPYGEVRYRSFGKNSQRLSQYKNYNQNKSLRARLLLSWEEEKSLELRLLESGRSFATERVGDYQTDQMSQSMENLSLLYSQPLAEWPLRWLAGVQWIKEQWERTRFIVQGNSVDSALDLSSEGKPQGGLREELSNLGLPLGARMRWGRTFFLEGEALWGFLLDPSDIFLGSAPYSGFSYDLEIALGWESPKWRISLGALRHFHHMASPASSEGKKLEGGTLAPEGVWVAWPENETLFQGILLQAAYRF